jgi:hypothetical protein
MRPWTRLPLYAASRLPAEDAAWHSGRPIAEIHLAQRLVWLYGLEPALERINSYQEQRLAA